MICRDLEEIRTSIVNGVASDCQHQFDNIDSKFTFPTIDFKSIVEKARMNEKNKKLENKEGVLNVVKRWFSKVVFFVGKEKREEWGKAYKEDSEKVAKDCQDIILDKIKEDIDIIIKVVSTFIVDVNDSIIRYNELIKRSENELRENTRTISDKEQTISKLENEISQIENAINCI